MEPLWNLADQPIRRAIGFYAFAVTLVLLGLSFDTLLAVRATAILVTGLWLVLLLWGVSAPRRDVRRTEFWLSLDGAALPEAAALRALPPDQRQRRIGALLRARLLWHAERVLWLAGGLWALVGVVAVLRLAGLIGGG
jgi:hypothetical protein